MDNKKGFSPPAVGGVSLLVAFAVLCLTVFALLSLTTVQANQRLAEASARAVTGYYAADCQAQEVLARLRAGETPADVAVSEHLEDSWHDPLWVRYTYACPISETRELQAEVLVHWDGSYQILRWQAASIGDWEANDTLELWDGTPF